MSRAAVVVTMCAIVSMVAATPSPPRFPGAYSALLNIQAQQQGGPLQTGSLNAYWERSSTFNGTAYIGVGTGQSSVYDFTTQIMYQIEGTRCNCFCPIQTLQCNLQDSLCTYDYLHSAKFAETTTMNGTTVNRFDWIEGIAIIPMNALQLYVNAQTNAPVFQYRLLEPFGKFLGTENTTWVDFAVGKPPASVWNIPDKKYCQRCTSCGPDDDDSSTDAYVSEFARFLN